MDLNSLMSESPKVMAIMNAIKNDPNLLEEIKANPQEAMSKIGVELNEEELGMVQKLGGLSELKGEVEGLFTTIKGWFSSSEKGN